MARLLASAERPLALAQRRVLARCPVACLERSRRPDLWASRRRSGQSWATTLVVAEGMMATSACRWVWRRASKSTEK